MAAIGAALVVCITNILKEKNEQPQRRKALEELMDKVQSNSAGN